LLTVRVPQSPKLLLMAGSELRQTALRKQPGSLAVRRRHQSKPRAGGFLRGGEVPDVHAAGVMPGVWCAGGTGLRSTWVSVPFAGQILAMNARVISVFVSWQPMIRPARR
jgi:hypothetical protein